MKNTLILLVVLTLVSCSDDDRLGIGSETTTYPDFFISNYTNKEFQGATIYIGALVNDEFYPTDSLITSQRIPPSQEEAKINNAGEQFSAIDLPLWNPNLDKISAISTKGTFYLKLSDGTSIKHPNDFSFPNPQIGGARAFHINDEDLSK